MKKLLLILLLTTPFIGFGQGCQYGSSTDASELCDFYKGNNFATYKNADIALDKILSVTGMSKRFVLKECNDISNCIATSYKGIRYILYDREFMDAIATRTNAWSSISILAHEIGHHVNGHSLDLIVYASEMAEAPTLAESRQMELEADEYSGFVMYKLGASLSQAQEAVRLICTNDDDTYSTHPKLDKRLRAIERGYNNAKSQGSNTNTSTKTSTLTAEDYFYKAYNNESDWQYKIDNYTKCLRIEPDYADAYNNRGVSYVKLEYYNEA
ncbi:MAG: M48 family metalloprotease, partial [Flavobacteriales bacterium]|nr:M48 family metalloprotease [Flavobacteriales bacterium]